MSHECHYQTENFLIDDQSSSSPSNSQQEVPDCISHETNLQEQDIRDILFDAGKVMEKMEEEEIGNVVGRRTIPGVAWQDDLIVIANSQDNEKKLVNSLDKSTKQNRILLEPTKCKTITIGKIWSYENAVLNGIELEDVEKGMILGHTFSSRNNNMEHIKEKENKTMEMMGAYWPQCH